MLWRQLVESDPVLALLFARGEEFGGIRPWPLVLASKEATCGSVGFPGNERTVRLLRRFVIDPEHAIRNLLLLRYLLAHEPWAFDVLEARQMICLDDIVHLAVGLENFERWGDLNAIEWFFRLPAPIRHFIGRLYAAADPFHNRCVEALIGPVKPLSDFHSKDEAIDWLKAFADWKEKIEIAELADDSSQWPEPPIPGTKTILPICSWDEFDAQFQSPRFYLDTHRVLLGEYYFYRLVVGQASMLGIAFVGGNWVIDQLLGPDGTNLQEEQICAEVEQWLRSAPESSRDISCRQSAWRLHLSRLAAKAGLPAPAGY